MPRAKTWIRLALLLGLVAAVVVGHQLGLNEYAEPEALQAWLTGSGVWGPIFFVVAYVIGYTLQLPGVLFVIAAGMTWPLQFAIPLSLGASLLATLVSFVFARYIARDWIQPRLPEKLKAWDQRLEAHGFTTVIILRVLMFLSPPVTYMLGVSRISLSSYMAGTAIGMLPGIALLSVGAASFETWSQKVSPKLGLALAAIVAALFAGRWLWQRRERPAAPPPTS